MRRPNTLWPALLLMSAPVGASHLTEAEVIAMEEKCQALREELLLPEKLDTYDACMAEGNGDDAACRERAGAQGARQIVGTNIRVGKYSDLPECQEAYRARKHYQVNPSLRDQ